ncbi:MAG TPA: GH92 family glycosyl hydrolase [Ignavibacteriales bacterium]|nr:GH92 family glycosyl hydrolase [Ignavibacteriales bacterium]
MKKILTLVLLLSTLVSAGDKGAKKINPANLVNPLVGTDSDYKLSNGNTYPAIALPWAMNFWSPQTGKMGSGWMYTYDEYKIKGFRQTHQPSPWIGDYGSFSIMPITGTLKFPEDERASWFSHKREIAKPYYYQVYLGDYNVSVEITPTERAAQFRVKYPKTDNSYVLIDAFNKGSYIKVIPKERKLIGYCRNNKGGVPENFHNYFVVYFDKEIDSVCTWSEKGIFPGRTEETADHVMAAVKFKTNENETVHIRTASSFISFDQAELNLKREIGNDSFTETMTKAEKVWNDGMSRIEIEGGTESQMKTFYTALYRTMLFPRGLYEMDKDNKVVHYSPYDGVVHPGYMFTDNGFWDTFRAAFPLLTIMQPGLCSRIMEGLVNTYNESGWLPEWASPGHRDCMIGSNSASVIAGTYLNGIRGYDINKLYEAILKNSENEGPLESVGRRGVKYYNSLGYVPYDVKINENAARTLEYSYDDFAIWKLAQALGRPKDETDRFARRSMNYKNVFDKSTGFMRGRDSNGTFQSPFRPDKWGDAFTEGCAWHYTWAVFHDPAGLMNLMGGREKFAAKLDSLFAAAPTFDYSYYGVQIHEITEMVIAGMGQYAHGNQPVQHAIYLYNYAGEPWKAQEHVREAMDILYTPEPDGLCGDEDNGQTSAWYVLSALGMYSVCPAAGEYVFGSPLFNKAVLHLENGKTFTIEASGNSHENIYIDKASLNGKDYTKNFLTHQDLMQGGSLEFRMSNKPNKDRGTGKGDLPYSFSKSN